jgi:hypothetical protein
VVPSAPRKLGVLVTPMATAAGTTAGAIGLRQGAAQGAPGQAGNLTEKRVAGCLRLRNRRNRL